MSVWDDGPSLAELIEERRRDEFERWQDQATPQERTRQRRSGARRVFSPRRDVRRLVDPDDFAINVEMTTGDGAA
jgi:hypothetical protein